MTNKLVSVIPERQNCLKRCPNPNDFDVEPHDVKQHCLLLTLYYLLYYTENRHNLYEPLREKICLCHMWTTKAQISLQTHAVWSESLLCTLWVEKDPMLLHADSEDSDQTGWMPRLARVLKGRKVHFVGFVVRWLIYKHILKNECVGILWLNMVEETEVSPRKTTWWTTSRTWIVSHVTWAQFESTAMRWRAI